MTINRRSMLRDGLGCVAAFAVESDGAAVARDAGCSGPTGMFTCDAQPLAESAQDFGHIIHKQARAVLRPASVEDIAAAIGWARSHGLKVAARGRGHSTYGRAMTDGGIVIDMGPMNTIHRIEADRIIVDAGATWQAVLAATLAKGLTPPVLPNYLGLSVGGTLAVGGIGGTTSRYGMQTDCVLALDVVTGDGRMLTCSADQNPDLFDSARAGLGQCSIITRATIRLVRAPERVLRFQLFYSDLARLTSDQRRVLADERFDQLQGAILPGAAGGWRYQLEGAVYYDNGTPPAGEAVLAELSDDRAAAVVSDLTYLEDATVFARLETLLRRNGQWSHPHPWWLSFLPGSSAEQIAARIVQGLTPDDVGSFGRVIYYPMATGAIKTPLLRLPDERIAVSFNIIRMPASPDKNAAAQMLTKNRMLHDSVRKEGGVLYPVSALPMTRDDWKDHFGSAWPKLQAAKERYDPDHLLTPGYEVF